MVESGLDTYNGCGHNLLHTSMLDEVIFHSCAKLFLGGGRGVLVQIIPQTWFHQPKTNVI
jgi:hypothetical protein